MLPSPHPHRLQPISHSLSLPLTPTVGLQKEEPGWALVSFGPPSVVLMSFKAQSFLAPSQRLDGIDLVNGEFLCDWNNFEICESPGKCLTAHFQFYLEWERKNTCIKLKKRGGGRTLWRLYVPGSSNKDLKIHLEQQLVQISSSVSLPKVEETIMKLNKCVTCVSWGGLELDGQLFPRVTFDFCPLWRISLQGLIKPTATEHEQTQTVPCF